MRTTTAPKQLLAWRPRITIRTRLTLSYAALVTGCGAILITGVYLFMRYVPYYSIVAAAPNPNPDVDAKAPLRPAETAFPVTAVPPSDAASAVTRSPTISISSAADVFETLLYSSVISLLILALLSSFIGWLIAGRVLKPLKAINAAATLAATGSLDHRIGVQGPRDEIRDLSDTFDEMLGALDNAFRAHRRFAANASHELRTPLATTQTMIDVTLSDSDVDATTLRTLANRIYEVNRGNIETVEALLDLANIGQNALRDDTVDLRKTAMEVVGALGQEATDRKLTIDFREGSPRAGLSVNGDPALIRQAINNLVQNAIRHNVDSGSIIICVERRISCIAVTIRNTGRIIPAELVESLKEPFFRGSGRAVSPVPGHGLGLAIAASIADAHNGSLRLTANPTGGLIAELSLPDDGK